MFNNLKKLSEDDKKKGEFSPFKPGFYIMKVKSAEVADVPEKKWSGSAMVETGEMVPQITVKFDVFTEKGETEIKTVEGATLVNPSYTTWINEGNLGWYKKENKPREGRAILTGLLGLGHDDEIPLGDVKILVGKIIKVYLTTEAKKDKSLRNKIVDVFAWETPGIAAGVAPVLPAQTPQPAVVPMATQPVQGAEVPWENPNLPTGAVGVAPVSTPVPPVEEKKS
jgi:hypothetical protein